MVKQQDLAIISWFPPESHVLKWNVDGSSIGKPRLAGIGGVLHNHKGLVLGFLSAPVGIKDSNEAELLGMILKLLNYLLREMILLEESLSLNLILLLWLTG